MFAKPLSLVLLCTVLAACSPNGNEAVAPVNAEKPAISPSQPAHQTTEEVSDSDEATAAESMAAADDVKVMQPSLDVTTVDGQAFSLEALRGQYVIVSFWATWCAPCLEEMPALSELHERRDDVSVVGLAFEEISTEDMQAFLVDHTPSYPVAIIDTFEPPVDFDVPRALPMNYVLDKQGKVIKKIVGPVTTKELERLIERVESSLKNTAGVVGS